MSYFEFPHTRNYDKDLGWLIKKVGELLECCATMTDWKTDHEEAYQELKDLYDDIMAGTLPEEVQAGFNKWMRENAADIVGEMIKMVFFGLTDTGYFVAYIPESWEDIIFNTTGYDITLALMPEFGHLVLSY
jgi:hypothetical protein